MFYMTADAYDWRCVGRVPEPSVRSGGSRQQRTAYGDPRGVGEFGGGGSEIRILFAMAHLGKGGGVALQAFQLFKILQRTVDVQLVCLDAPGKHRGLTQEPGVIVAGPLVFPRGIQTLAQALRSSRHDHDVFHALDPYYAFPATYLARVFPRIITLATHPGLEIATRYGPAARAGTPAAMIPFLSQSVAS